MNRVLEVVNDDILEIKSKLDNLEYTLRSNIENSIHIESLIKDKKQALKELDIDKTNEL